jgi:uncharacterized protein YggE
MMLASAAALATLSAPAVLAQTIVAPAQTLSGTRLDVVAQGEVNRVPDIVRVSAGVTTLAATATEALAQNATRMASVRAALRRAGVADRDIQTNSLNLQPEYRHQENRTPELVGYRTHNEVMVRFRDIANTGKILDALVAQGANQINGPMLGLDRPEEAMDEARTRALAVARARAELYAKAMGKRVGRILSVSESGGHYAPMMRQMSAAVSAVREDSTVISPGEQTVAVSLAVSFELE